ncbi:MAG: hypothetical protein ETSY2_35105 [Candidatus Entotheonella gemina]|uniref:Uncharacterized protein n=1 Tax=Candidatus Entotheonella gemina TaxID=1429439 RepID=W4LZ52_9BACT|nr:MAG: hypothetical protein ETSY2_35105 [Candidatus Entotheonella gemina]
MEKINIIFIVIIHYFLWVIMMISTNIIIYRQMASPDAVVR